MKPTKRKESSCPGVKQLKRQRMKRINAATKLESSDNLLREIFLRLPPRSNYRFKCVSKRWNDILSNDPELVVPEEQLGLFLNDVEVLHGDPWLGWRWFRCKVLRLSDRCQSVLVQYYNVLNDADKTKLEEWIPLGEVADYDQWGKRHVDRFTIRPCPPEDVSSCHSFNEEDVVDAWVDNSWLEGGTVSRIQSYDGSELGSCDGSEHAVLYSVHFPGSRKLLCFEKKNLRVSRDWIDGDWVEPYSGRIHLATEAYRPVNLWQM